MHSKLFIILTRFHLEKVSFPKSFVTDFTEKNLDSNIFSSHLAESHEIL